MTINITNVTSEQISKAHRTVSSTGEIYYKVESQTTEGTEYEVRYLAGKGITCNCPAGERGNNCWHKRAAVAHSLEYKAEQKAIAEYEALQERIARLEAMGLTRDEATQAAHACAIINGKPATDEELVRVYGPRIARPTEAEIELDAQRYQARAFSLMH